MKCRQILDALLKKNALRAAVLGAGLLFTNAAFAELEIPNGNFEDGEITADGDTIPLEWGGRLNGDACKSNGTCVYMDFEDKVEGEASMRIEGTEGGKIIIVNGIQGLFPYEEQEIVISGKYKVDMPLGTSGKLGIAAVPFCGGGGYKQLGYHHMARATGSTDGWVEFEWIETVPSSQKCADDYNYSKGSISIHIYFNDGGTVWVDDFKVCPIEGCPDDPTSVSQLSQKHLTKNQNIRLANRTVQFDQATNYTITIARPNGRIHAIRKGTGTSAELFTKSVAAGTYVVNVLSELGTISRTVIIDQ